MVTLPDPQLCRQCGARGKVVDTRMRQGYRLRRRQCVCGYIWKTFETTIDPKTISEKPRTVQHPVDR